MKRYAWWVLFAGLGFALLTIQTRNIWLPWIAMNLVVADDLSRADLIVVFAAAEERAQHAARLYKAKLAPMIAATGGVPIESLAAFCHKRVTGAEFMAKLLVDRGVPKDALRVIPIGTSTYEEAEAIKDFMQQNGYRSVIAVSSPYHMRRVRSTLSHLLRDTAISTQYSAAEGADFDVAKWWQRERDLIRVSNEYLKLAYYHLALF